VYPHENLNTVRWRIAALPPDVKELPRRIVRFACLPA